MKVKFSIINLVLGGYSLDSKHFSDCIMCVSLLLVPTICVCLYHVCLSVSSVSLYFICVCLYHLSHFTTFESVCFMCVCLYQVFYLPQAERNRYTVYCVMTQTSLLYKQRLSLLRSADVKPRVSPDVTLLSRALLLTNWLVSVPVPALATLPCTHVSPTGWRGLYCVLQSNH